MELIKTLILLVVGFVAFFATGIDDTLAYAGIYLEHKQKDHKKFFSLGIMLGTVLALGISIFAGSLMEALPSRHLIGGAVLITIGIITFTRGKKTRQNKKSHILKMKKRIKRSHSSFFTSIKFIGLGVILFFATGVDDIITYSNLIMAKGTWLAICLGVLIATIVSLIIAHFLADKLKGFSHPEKIGGTIIIIIGILLILKIL